MGTAEIFLDLADNVADTLAICFRPTGAVLPAERHQLIPIRGLRSTHETLCCARLRFFASLWHVVFVRFWTFGRPLIHSDFESGDVLAHPRRASPTSVPICRFRLGGAGPVAGDRQDLGGPE